MQQVVCTTAVASNTTRVTQDHPTPPGSIFKSSVIPQRALIPKTARHVFGQLSRIDALFPTPPFSAPTLFGTVTIDALFPTPPFSELPIFLQYIGSHQALKIGPVGGGY